MNKSEEGKYNNVRNALINSIVICIVVFISSSFAIPGLLAQETGAAVEVRVTPESEYVEEGATFSVTIDVDDVKNFKLGQFDLSFDSKVLKLKDVEDGSLDGEKVPIKEEREVDDDTVHVYVRMPMGETASGSGYLAEVSFKAIGAEGDTSKLDLSNGLLSDNTAEILANWTPAEIKIGSEKEEDDEEEEEELSEEVITPGSPKITVSKPAEVVVGNVVRESRAFNICVNQIADIIWQINGSEVQTNESVTEASFTKSAVIGTWNVSAIATNATTGLSDTHSWIWYVTLTATPSPTLAPRVTPAPTRAPGVTPTPKPVAITRPTAKPKPKSTPTPTPKPAGFDAIFAIAMLAIAYMLVRKR